MRTLAPLLAFAAVPLGVLAAAARVPTLKEAVITPHGWTRRARAPAEHKINLRIGLPQGDFPALERHLYEVSDPNHERYGKHLSKAEVEALVQPHPDSITVVNEWLESHGIDVVSDVSRSPAQDWATVTVPVSLAEQLLHTEYHVYEHTDGNTLVRTTSYSLPSHVHAHVDVVQPTTMFGLFKPMRSTIHEDNDRIEAPALAGNVLASTGATVNASCNSTIIPQCLYDLYEVDYNGTAANGNSIAITGYLSMYMNFTDLDMFDQAYFPAVEGSNVSVYYVNGGINNQSESGPEAMIDSEYAFGIGYPAKATFYTTGGSPPFQADNFTTFNTNEPYQEWLDFVLNQTEAELPLVISTSYGDEEQSVPRSYALRVCAGMAQLGARGVSVFFSSGDSGVGDGSSNVAYSRCYANDGSGRPEFLPTFPATCPYVTSVGGTQYIQPETAARYSGGGFSNYFSRPLYQALAVPGFLSQLPNTTYAGLYNATGRGFPDISAQSANFVITIQGVFSGGSGTSASTPAIAGMFAKLNALRLQAGMPSIGFANPLLYGGAANARGFHDVTAGNNPGCGTPGFNATAGWDPVTGLGTPNFPELKELVLDFDLY